MANGILSRRTKFNGTIKFNNEQIMNIYSYDGDGRAHLSNVTLFGQSWSHTHTNGGVCVMLKYTMNDRESYINGVRIDMSKSMKPRENSKATAMAVVVDVVVVVVVRSIVDPFVVVQSQRYDTKSLYYVSI